MISFHNPEFHDKIMKKYGRIIRKSYFPNLFFRQGHKFSVPESSRIFLNIKYNFCNTLLCKNFLLSSPKEKQPGYSFFLSEFKLFGLKHPEPLNKRNKLLNLRPEKNEPIDLINHLFSTGFLSPNLIPPEPVITGFSSPSPVSLRLIDHKTKICSLHSSNRTTLFNTVPNYTYLNNSFANYIYPNFKFFTLSLFENNKWMPFFKIGARLIRNELNSLRNCRNFFSKEKSLFFVRSVPPAVNESIFQKVGHAAYYPALSPASGLEANKFSRKIHSEILRRIEYLRFSGRTRVGESRTSDDFSKPLTISFISGRLKPLRFREPATENLKLRIDSKNRAKEKEMPYLKGLINILCAQPGSRRILDMNFIPSVRFMKNFLEKNAFFPYWKSSTISDSDKTDIHTLHRRQKVVSLEPSISVFRQQKRTIDRLMLGIFEEICSSSVKKKARSLRTVRKLSSFLNLRSDPVSRKVRAFNWLTALKYNTADISQLNRPETSTGGSIVAYQLFPKPASEFANITGNLAVVYPLSDSHVAYYHIPRNYCIALSQELDSKREELKSKKQFHFKISRLQSILLHHLFLKSPGKTIFTVKSPAMLCSSGKNVLQKVRFKASPAHRSFLALAASSHFHKIRNEQVRNVLLRKAERLKISSSGVLLRYVSEKKSHAEVRYYRTSYKLLEALIRTYYSENFNRKLKISIDAAESSQISKRSVLERPELEEKKDLIERKVEQKLGELITSRSIQNTNFSIQNTKFFPSIQFLILNFLGKTVLSSHNEHSSVTESNGISLRTVYKQEKGLFQSTKKRIGQLLPVDVKLLAKKTISGRKVPGKFSRNLFMLQNFFLQEDVQRFPETNIQKSFKLFPFTGNFLLINKNGTLNTGSSSSPSASTLSNQESKNIINSHKNIALEKRHLYSQYQFQKIIGLSKFPVPFRTEARGEGENQTNVQRQLAIQAQDGTATYKPERSVQEFGFVAAPIFNNLLNRLNMFRLPEGRKSTGKVTHITGYLRDEYHLSDHRVAAHYTISSQKAENEKKLKTKKQLLFQFSRLNSKLIQPFFVKSLEIINYTSKRAKYLLFTNIQNFTYDNSSIPARSLQNAQIFSLQQKLPFNITSPYTSVYQGTASLSSQTTSTQNHSESQEFSYKKNYFFEYSTTLISKLKASAINYPAIYSSITLKSFHSSTILNKDHLERRAVLEKRTCLALSGLSRSFLKKRVPQTLSSGVFLRRNVLKLFKISYSLSRMNTSSAVEYFSALSNRQNFVSKGAFSSNSLFSEGSLNASIPLLSETGGIAFAKKLTQLFNLSKHADATIFKNPIFTGKPGFSSNKGSQSSKSRAQESKADFISHFTGMPELSGQKAPYLKAVRMNLILGSGKRIYVNAGNSLHRDSANFLKKVKSSLQVNKKQDIPAVSRIIPRTPFDIILSTIPDFEAEMKWKEIFSFNGPEKKSGDEKAVSRKFLFKFRSIQSPKNASKSSIYPEFKNAYSTFFTLRGEGGKTPGITNFGTFETLGDKRSELMHAGESYQKTGREDLVYGTSEPLFEEVKKIKRIIFETREIVADHLGSHMPRATGNPEQVMDIEYMSEKIIQSINYKLKIEAERRGIF